MIKILKKHFLLLLLSFLFLNLLFIINIYLDLKGANVVNRISVEVNTGEEFKNDIKVIRQSISGFELEMFKDEKFKVFYSFTTEYFKNIKINFTKDVIINFIKVNIGNKDFIANTNELKKYWIIKQDKDNIELISNNKLSLPRSKLPKINQIINWTGDFNFFILRYILYFCFYVFIVIFFLFITNKLKINNDKKILNQLNDYFFNNIKREYLYKTLYASALLFVVFFAILQRFSINALPYDGNDTGSYITFITRYFSGNSIIYSANRGFPYLLFVFGIIKIFNDFAYISIIQHILGIITGLIILKIWNEIFNKLLAADKKYKILFDYLGLFTLALYLFNQSVIVYEHSIRPEGIYGLFLGLIILLFLKIFNNLKSSKINIFIYLNIFFFLNYFIFIMQPRYGLTILLNLLIYFIVFFNIKTNIFKKVIFLIALPIFISLLLIYIPNNLFSNKNNKGVFLSAKLFFTHPKIIDKILMADINNPDFKIYDKKVLKQLMIYHNIEYNRKQYKHKFLGFDHNSLVYGQANKYLHEKFNRNEYNKFCRYYFIKAVKKYPLLYIKKVLLELSQFYNFEGGMYPSRTFKVDWIAFEHEDSYEPEVKYLAQRGYSNMLSLLKRSYYDFNEIRFPVIEAFYFILAKIYLIVFFLFFILYIYKLINYKKNNNKNEIIFGLLIIILFIYNFCISLTNAAVYCLDVARYIDDQFLIVLFSQVLALVYIVLEIKKSFKNELA